MSTNAKKRGKARPWVIKFGGSLLANARARRAFLKETAALAQKRPLVLVHGGGPEINEAMAKRGLTPKFVNGRRYTDDSAMAVVEQVLSGQVNKSLAGELNALGARAVGLSGRDGDMILAKSVKGLGRVGAPAAVSTGILDALLAGRYLPVVSSVAAKKGDRSPLNVNADEAASALAAALKAARLIFMTDVAGVLDSRKKTIPILRSGRIGALVREKVILGGMIPKILSCRAALRKGVKEIDILDGRAGLSSMKGTRILP